MAAKLSRWTGLGLAAACAAVLAVPARAAPRRRANTALDDRLYAVALSSSTPQVYRDRLMSLLKRREHKRLRVLKAQGRSRSRGGARVSGYGPAARLSRMRVPDPALGHLLRDQGGVVSRTDRAAVRIPPEALPQSVDITVSQPDAADEAARRAAAVNEDRAQASLPVAFGPDGTLFARPVTITIPYDPILVASQGLSEADLKVHYWNPRLSHWEELPSTVDAIQKSVSAQTTHFSVYEVLDPGTGGVGVAATADPSFGFKAAYAFPNPSRGGAAVTFRVQPGLADSVEVDVYDLSGRKIHSSSDFRSVGAFDDGNGLGAQFTYEHAWSVSGVGSGVYTFVVVARKAGRSDIRKTGKVAVVK